jgi:hypothetical protein
MHVWMELTFWLWWLFFFWNSAYTSAMSSRSGNQKFVDFFKSRLLKRTTFFLGHDLSRRWNKQPFIKISIRNGILSTYRMMLKVLVYLGWNAASKPFLNCRCQGIFCRASRRLSHGRSLFFRSFDRYAIHLAPCKIWRCLAHVAFVKEVNSSQKSGLGNNLCLWPCMNRSFVKRICMNLSNLISTPSWEPKLSLISTLLQSTCTCQMNSIPKSTPFIQTHKRYESE